MKVRRYWQVEVGMWLTKCLNEDSHPEQPADDSNDNYRIASAIFDLHTLPMDNWRIHLSWPFPQVLALNSGRTAGNVSSEFHSCGEHSLQRVLWGQLWNPAMPKWAVHPVFKLIWRQSRAKHQSWCFPCWREGTTLSPNKGQYLPEARYGQLEKARFLSSVGTFLLVPWKQCPEQTWGDALSLHRPPPTSQMQMPTSLPQLMQALSLPTTNWGWGLETEASEGNTGKPCVLHSNSLGEGYRHNPTMCHFPKPDTFLRHISRMRKWNRSFTSTWVLRQCGQLFPLLFYPKNKCFPRCVLLGKRTLMDPGRCLLSLYVRTLLEIYQKSLLCCINSHF